MVQMLQNQLAELNNNVNFLTLYGSFLQFQLFFNLYFLYHKKKRDNKKNVKQMNSGDFLIRKIKRKLEETEDIIDQIEKV